MGPSRCDSMRKTSEERRTTHTGPYDRTIAQIHTVQVRRQHAADGHVREQHLLLHWREITSQGLVCGVGLDPRRRVLQRPLRLCRRLHSGCCAYRAIHPPPWLSCDRNTHPAPRHPSVDIFRLCSSGRAFLCCNCRNGCQCSPDTRYQPQWRFPPGMDPQSSMLVDPPAQKGRRDSVQRWVRQLHSRYASFNAQWAPYRPCAALRHR